MPPIFTLGKAFISLVNLITMIAPYLADWKFVLPNPFNPYFPLHSPSDSISETHIYNPTWPPHARYHNGQTMSMGLFIGLISFYIIFVTLPSASSRELQLSHVTWVSVLQTLYYASSLSGILYPGASWMDPEFGEGRPQLYGFPVLIGLVWVGWGVERGRILGQGRGKKA